MRSDRYYICCLNFILLFFCFLLFSSLEPLIPNITIPIAIKAKIESINRGITTADFLTECLKNELKRRGINVD